MESETKLSSGKRELGKRIALAALAAACVGLVYRNLVAPALPGGSVSATATVAGSKSPPRSSSPSRGQAGDDSTMDRQELSALDPTLRVDLLDMGRQVEYTGTFRNIFQFYTPPPPKPVAPAIVGPPAEAPAARPGAATVSIPLKFYGVASRTGSAEKKAFLAEGDDIFIGQEGDTVDKNYKITRIGMTSIELEDIRTKQKHQLQLVPE